MYRHNTITRAQRVAVSKLYRPERDGTYRSFRRKFINQYGGYIANPNWRGMYVGIEADGYTHT